MTAPIHRCHRGSRCYAHEIDQESREKLGAPCDRPLCQVCEVAVTRALDEAPAMYVRLRNATLRRDTAAASEHVTRSTGSPMPLNAGALHLGEQLWWLLVTWEDEVRAIAGLSSRFLTGVREGRQVADAARLLGAHLTAWLAAPETTFTVNTGRDPSTDPLHAQSGVQAASALLDWRSAVRRLPGFDTTAPKALRRYTQPCPACGVRAVTHRAGDDLMHCQSCGATAPYLPSMPGLPAGAQHREGSAA